MNFIDTYLLQILFKKKIVGIYQHRKNCKITVDSF